MKMTARLFKVLGINSKPKVILIAIWARLSKKVYYPILENNFNCNIELYIYKNWY